MYRQPETPPVIIAAAMPHMAIPGGALPLQPQSVIEKIMCENNCLRKGKIIWQTEKEV